MFVLSKCLSRLINTRHIVELREIPQVNKDDPERARATLVDDTKVDLHCGMWERIHAFETMAVIPAQPGYEALRWGRDDSDQSEWVNRGPVVAWRVTHDTAHPVVGLDREDWSAVKRPDGSVIEYEDGVYANEAKWLEAMREEHAEMLAWRAKIKQAAKAASSA